MKQIETTWKASDNIKNTQAQLYFEAAVNIRNHDFFEIFSKFEIINRLLAEWIEKGMQYDYDSNYGYAIKMMKNMLIE